MDGVSNAPIRERLCIYLPSYNAAPFLARTVERIPFAELPADLEVALLFVDNASTDGCQAQIERCRGRLAAAGIASSALLHPVNCGYGGSVKSALRWGLDQGFDYLVVLHADGQYSPEALPRLLGALRAAPTQALHFGSRLTGRPLEGGMPLYKLLANRTLTALQNRVLGLKLSEYHSGYRLYRLAFLREAGFERATDSFVFDNQIIFLLRLRGHEIGESPIPTFYGEEVSHVPLLATPLGILANSLRYWLARRGWRRDPLYQV